MTDRHSWEDELAEQEISSQCAEIERLTAENERFTKGVREIKRYLDEDRNGDASFTAEALLAGSEQLRK